MDQIHPPPQSRWSKTSVIILALMIIVSGGLLGGGFVSEWDSALIASGALGFIVTGASIILYTRKDQRVSGVSSTLTPDDRQLLSQLHEHSMLSDNAKRILFRERELQLVRSAIQNHISATDYNAALILCDELMNLYGQRQEAEQYRSQILQMRREHYEQQVRTAMEQFDGYLRLRDWATAHQEAARLKRLFPDSPAVAEVDRRIFTAREEHKRDLEQQFLEAAEHDETTQAMDLLRELDRYLSREEADRLGTMAEKVVTRHRETLSERFKEAISAHHWEDARDIGDEITAEFPNSRMADEVRGMKEMLLARATQATEVVGEEEAVS